MGILAAGSYRSATSTDTMFYSVGRDPNNQNTSFHSSVDGKTWTEIDYTTFGLRDVNVVVSIGNNVHLFGLGTSGSANRVVSTSDEFDTWYAYDITYEIKDAAVSGNALLALTYVSNVVVSIEFPSIDQPPILRQYTPYMTVLDSFSENSVFGGTSGISYTSGQGTYTSDDGEEWVSKLSITGELKWSTKYKDTYYFREDSNGVEVYYKTTDFITVTEIPELTGNVILIDRRYQDYDHLGLWNVDTSTFYRITPDQTITPIQTTGITAGTYVGNYMYDQASGFRTLFAYNQQYYSNDGIAWTRNIAHTRTLKTSFNVGSVYMYLYMSGNNADMAVSTNGIDWNPATLPTSLYQGAYAGFDFLAAPNGKVYFYRTRGDYTTFWSTTDGLTWTVETPPLENNSVDIKMTYIGNTMYAFMVTNNKTVVYKRANFTGPWAGGPADILDSYDYFQHINSDGVDTAFVSYSNRVYQSDGMLRTSDGGKTYTRFDLPFDNVNVYPRMFTKINGETFLYEAKYNDDDTRVEPTIHKTANYTDWFIIKLDVPSIPAAMPGNGYINNDGRKWSVVANMDIFYRSNILVMTSRDFVEWRTLVLHSSDDAATWQELPDNIKYTVPNYENCISNSETLTTFNEFNSDVLFTNSDGTVWSSVPEDVVYAKRSCGYLFSGVRDDDETDEQRMVFSRDGLDWFEPSTTLYLYPRNPSAGNFYTTADKIYDYSAANEYDESIESWKYSLTLYVRDYSGAILETHLIRSVNSYVQNMVGQCGYVNGKHYVVVDGSSLYSSVDLNTWTLNNGIDGNPIDFINGDFRQFSNATNNTQLIFKTGSKQVLRSTNLIDWELIDIPTIAQYATVSSITYSAKTSQFIAMLSEYDPAANREFINAYSSLDGSTWTPYALPTRPENLKALIVSLKNGDIFIAARGFNNTTEVFYAWTNSTGPWEPVDLGETPTGIYVSGPQNNVPQVVNLLVHNYNNNTVLFNSANPNTPT